MAHRRSRSSSRSRSRTVRGTSVRRPSRAKKKAVRKNVKRQGANYFTRKTSGKAPGRRTPGTRLAARGGRTSVRQSRSRIRRA